MKESWENLKSKRKKQQERIVLSEIELLSNSESHKNRDPPQTHMHEKRNAQTQIQKHENQAKMKRTIQRQTERKKWKFWWERVRKETMHEKIETTWNNDPKWPIWEQQTERESANKSEINIGSSQKYHTCE